MEEKDKTNITIASDMSNLEGVTAHMFQVTSNQSHESRIDFIYVDQLATSLGADSAPAKVVARVNMTTERLLELRKLLDDHIDGMTKGM